jgi:hypothetical protein
MSLPINAAVHHLRAVANTPTAFVRCSAARGDSLGGLHDVNLQCLRVLRCTALAMVSSPGGLRFKAGSRPWLEGLPKPLRAPEPACQAF